MLSVFIRLCCFRFKNSQICKKNRCLRIHIMMNIFLKSTAYKYHSEEGSAHWKFGDRGWIRNMCCTTMLSTSVWHKLQNFYFRRPKWALLDLQDINEVGGSWPLRRPKIFFWIRDFLTLQNGIPESDFLGAKLYSYLVLNKMYFGGISPSKLLLRVIFAILGGKQSPS